MTKLFLSAVFTIAVLFGTSAAYAGSGPAAGICPDDPKSQFHDFIHCW